MDVKLNETIEQKLLSRKVVKGTVTFEGATPTRIDLKNKVAALESAKPEAVVVTDIKPVFGTNTASFNARVYESEELCKKIENEHIIKKSTPKAEETAEEGN